MARPGLVQNIVRYVLEPTIGQQLLGFKLLIVEIDPYIGIVKYYGYEQEVSWDIGSGTISYYLGPRGFPDKRTYITINSGTYEINRYRMSFCYANRNAKLEFQGRYPILILISRRDKMYTSVEVATGPHNIRKKLISPDLKLDGSFEDAQLALKYLLDLKDQMIKLGY